MILTIYSSLKTSKLFSTSVVPHQDETKIMKIDKRKTILFIETLRKKTLEKSD